MSQGPKGYIAQICSIPAVWKQYNKMAVLHFFSSKFHSNIYSILFGLWYTFWSGNNSTSNFSILKY